MAGMTVDVIERMVNEKMKRDVVNVRQGTLTMID